MAIPGTVDAKLPTTKGGRRIPVALGPLRGARRRPRTLTIEYPTACADCVPDGGDDAGGGVACVDAAEARRRRGEGRHGASSRGDSALSTAVHAAARSK